LFTNPNEAAAYKLIGLALVFSVFWKYSAANPELLDLDHMQPFIRESLLFKDPMLKRDNIFEELDKHEVRRVYRETTGKPLAFTLDDDPMFRKIARERIEDAEIRINEKKRQKYSGEDKRTTVDPEAIKTLGMPPRSPHLQIELEQLDRGDRVDITDSWKLNSLRRSSHDFYAKVRQAILDPQAYTLIVTIGSEGFTQNLLNSHALFLRLKQDLYDFFRGVHEEAWMEPYLRFVRSYECVCEELVDDPFLRSGEAAAEGGHHGR
jgi:hypothetical protein